MSRGSEAVLALVLTLVLGAAFWLFTGESIGTGPTGSSTPPAVDESASGRGETIANDVGCFACHSTDGTEGTGPTWQGLAGSETTLESGETVTADDDYLTLSIVDPGAQIVAGFDAVMPATYANQLTAEEIGDLVAYIKSLA